MSFYSPSQSSGHHMPGRNIPKPFQLCLQFQGAFAWSFLRISSRPHSSHCSHSTAVAATFPVWIPCIPTAFRSSNKARNNYKPKPNPPTYFCCPGEQLGSTGYACKEAFGSQEGKFPKVTLWPFTDEKVPWRRAEDFCSHNEMVINTILLLHYGQWL